VSAAVRLALAVFVTIGAIRASSMVAAEEIVHGADAVFRDQGLAMGWAVARERDETKTVVLVRVVDAAGRFAAVAVDGVDPFTNKRIVLVPSHAAAGTDDIVIPRVSFGDWPRTEFHFYAAQSDTPALTVYYLGVPDTTPEFTDRAAARRYLDQAMGAK
jgi:hypothetical protein